MAAQRDIAGASVRSTMQDEDVNKIIGKNIRIRRALRGYTQKAVARHLGVTFQQVQKYEKGQNMVSPAKLLRLSKLFSCAVEDLVHDPTRDKNALASIPGRRSLHLVQSFERIDSPELQKRIGDLVHVLARPAREGS
jgi:transcriptional regulator with XRE-family HTH domain